MSAASRSSRYRPQVRRRHALPRAWCSVCGTELRPHETLLGRCPRCGADLETSGVAAEEGVAREIARMGGARCADCDSAITYEFFCSAQCLDEAIARELRAYQEHVARPGRRPNPIDTAPWPSDPRAPKPAPGRAPDATSTQGGSGP